MLSKLRDYTYDHIKEMANVMKHSEKIGEEDYELEKGDKQ
jgi:hypothetical protein